MIGSTSRRISSMSMVPERLTSSKIIEEIRKQDLGDQGSYNFNPVASSRD